MEQNLDNYQFLFVVFQPSFSIVVVAAVFVAIVAAIVAIVAVFVGIVADDILYEKIINILNINVSFEYKYLGTNIYYWLL